MMNLHQSAIKQAITLHQLHMDKPKTATMESQEKLMQLLKKALMPKMSTI